MDMQKNKKRLKSGGLYRVRTDLKQFTPQNKLFKIAMALCKQSTNNDELKSIKSCIASFVMAWIAWDF
jgi:hypothetical protein